MESDNKKHTILKISLIFAAIFVILFYMINFTAISEFMGWVGSIFMPVFVGIAIAYILNPILDFYETKVFVWKKDTKAKINICRFLSITMTFVTLVAALTLIFILIIPQIVASISDFIANFENYLISFLDNVNRLMSNVLNGGIYKEYISMRDIQELTGSLGEADGNFPNNIIEKISSVWDKISQVGSGVFNSLYNFLRNGIIGIFISIYILATKELRIAQAHKIGAALFPEKVNSLLDEIFTVADKSFGGYIRGQFLDSCILGVLSYLVFVIFKISDFNIMLAFFIGCTNMVPVFGPVFGVVVVGFIVLVTNPQKLLLYIVLILIVQQIDGNIINPKILGSSTKISSLAVIISITVMGGLFGVLGMFIGVPVAATIITVVKNRIDRILESKNKPTSVEEYIANKIEVAAETEKHKAEKTWIYKYEHSKFKLNLDKKYKKNKKSDKTEQSDSEKQNNDNND